MKNSEGSRHIGRICAFSIGICLFIMCFQVNGHKSYANAENSDRNDVIYANAEVSADLSIKEKIEQDSSLWGALARALWDMVEPWQG